MTYAEAIAKLEAHTPVGKLAVNMREAGILAVKDVEEMERDFYAEYPKAAPGSLKMNGRTPEQMREYIVGLYIV